MTTYDDNDSNHLRYAEYVLGVLDADARAAVAQEMMTNEAAAGAVALWQRQLAPLAEDIAEVAPPDSLWLLIGQALQLETPHHTGTRPSLWENLRVWRWLGIGASLLAAACIVAVVATRARQSTVSGASLMVASLKQDTGVASWTATLDLLRKQIILVPITPGSIAQNRSTELWLIPHGENPVPVGVFTPDAITTLPLSAVLLAQLGPTAVLAVSVEPVGGSPTGQPTGPVIATGAIRVAPSTAARSAITVTMRYPAGEI